MPSPLDAVYLALLAASAPALLYKRLRHGKYGESFPGMMGKRLPARPLPLPREHRCWMHGVSVGETVAAGSVYRHLREQRSGWEFLATTTTETGQAQARRTYAGGEHFAYAPADFSWTVDAFLRAYRPSLYLFFETEIWPNLLHALGRRSIPAFLVNGKVSERSGRRYARVAFALRGPLSSVRRFYMQTQQDAERMARILGGEDRIQVAGNVKFDSLPEPLTADERRAWRARWGVSDDACVVLAGSTHPGEEETIWKAFAEARAQAPGLRLVLAPRHPERFPEVAEFLRRAAGSVHRTSSGEPAPAGAAVVLLDEMGVLARAFGAADIAIVAGSWKPDVGGHNLLEAGRHGIPVLRGPHMHAQPDITRVLGPGQGAPCVEAAELGGTLARLAADPGERRALGERARDASTSNLGAARRVVEDLLGRLP